MIYIIDNDEEYSLHCLYFVDSDEPDLERFFELAKLAYPPHSGYGFPYVVGIAPQIAWRSAGDAMTFTSLFDRVDDWFRDRTEPVDLDAVTEMLLIVQKHRPDKFKQLADFFLKEDSAQPASPFGSCVDCPHHSVETVARRLPIAATLMCDHGSVPANSATLSL